MATNYSPKIVTDGLVLCLDAANQKSYPGSGNTWSDLSGNGNDGILQGTPTFSSENNGVFETSSGRWFDLGNALFLDNNSPFTASGWMLFNSFSSRDMLLSRNNAVRSASPYTWLLGTINSGSVLAAYDGSSWRTRSFSFQTGVWYNVAFSYDGSTMTYYVNGDSIGTNSYTFSDSQTGRNTQVGGYSGNSQDLDGKYGTVMFYFRALSAEEIRQNFNALKGRYGL